MSLHITLSPEAKAIASKLATMPTALPAAVAVGLDKGNQYAIAKIQRDHLTGKGPFPPGEHRLGVRTDRLRSSLTASPAVNTGKVIYSSIGTNVEYAAIHEFGGTIHFPARSAKVRHRIDARGVLLRNLKNSNLAIFARKTHKRAREISVTIPAHEVTMPERAPIRTGLEESAPSYKQAIGRAIKEALGGFDMTAIDIIDLLPEEFANRLICDPFFSDIPVVVAEKGNLLAELEKKQAVITQKNGKRGIAVIVLQLTADDTFPNLQFGPMTVKPAFQVVENVELNRDASGTGKSARKVARKIRDIIKTCILNGLIADLKPSKPCIEPVDLTPIAANLVGYQVNFECLEHTQEQQTVVQMPVISAPADTENPYFELACATPGAEIWFTTDDSFPFNGTADDYPGSTAQLYTAAVPFTGSVVVRAGAYLNGSIASGIPAPL